jgi:hypothetical protein
MGLLQDLGNSIRNVFGGFFLLLISVPLIGWNECSSVRVADSLDEGAAAVVELDSASDGDLVHLTGEAEAAGPIVDTEVGVQSDALVLTREVEMYQWKEHRRNKNDDNSKKGAYVHELDWEDHVIKSSSFKEPQGHTNPDRMPFEDETWYGKDVTVGGYTIGKDHLRKLGSGDELPINTPPKPDLKVSNGLVYKGLDPASPQVGDVRIAYRAVPMGEISIVGKKQGNRIVPHKSSLGDTIALAEMGYQSAEEMFDSAQAQNTAATWGIRVVGFFVILGGFMLILGPLRVVVDQIPLVGGLINSGIFLSSALLAVFVTGVVTGIAWLAAHPLLGIVLLGAAGAAGFGLFQASRRG